MPPSVEAPTPEALADLVARCAQINRFTTQLTAVEETRIAALAAGILVMCGVLGLPEIASDRMPMRQQRISHWELTPSHLGDLATPAIRKLHGTLALDEHEQIKILSGRGWRGAWSEVTLWRDGVHGLSSRDLMEYLAALTVAAQQRAPAVAERLLERSKAAVAASNMTTAKPRMR